MDVLKKRQLRFRPCCRRTEGILRQGGIYCQWLCLRVIHPWDFCPLDLCSDMIHCLPCDWLLSIFFSKYVAHRATPLESANIMKPTETSPSH